EPDGVQTQLGINSPTYRQWYEERKEWNENPSGEAPELEDPLAVDREALSGGTWLTTNFFFGSTGAEVEASLDVEPAEKADRTQRMEGGAIDAGPEYSDTYAVAQQLVQGGSLAERTMQLGRFDLPADLVAGTQSAEVTATEA